MIALYRYVWLMVNIHALRAVAYIFCVVSCWFNVMFVREISWLAGYPGTIVNPQRSVYAFVINNLWLQLINHRWFAYNCTILCGVNMTYMFTHRSKESFDLLLQSTDHSSYYFFNHSGIMSRMHLPFTIRYKPLLIDHWKYKQKSQVYL